MSFDQIADKALAIAVLNGTAAGGRSNKAKKVEGVVAKNAFFDVRDAHNERLLRRLIARTEQWVAEEFDRLRDKIKAELEATYVVSRGELAETSVDSARASFPCAA